ncbi:hypothetical protein RUM43_015010 [Polyplax serrata]|uniref:Uncharacterized protein n=2 Tax=Polyplax serrata TaxID=468196 RepID=A0AAN8P3T9_POLSC
MVMLREEMYSSVIKVQTYIQNVDHEFDMMNTCAKSVKNIFLNFGKVYRDIVDGGKSLDDALRHLKNNIPEELKSNISDFMNLPLNRSLSSLVTDNLDQTMTQTISSLELALSKIKAGTGDEDISPGLFSPKTTEGDDCVKV